MVRFIRAVVGYAALRKVIRADFFRAVPRAHLRFAFVVNFFIAFFFFNLVKLGAQHGHGFFAVFALVALFAAGYDNARRLMDNAHGGFHLVYVLAARAAGTAGFHFQIFGADFNVNFFGFRHNRHRNRGRMHAARCFGVWHALHAVRARFVAKPGVCALALDKHTDVFAAF